MALAFIENPDNKPQVNHKNCDKADNRLDNLEWVTASENLIHAYRNGMIEKKGERHHKNKLTDKDVLRIRSIKGKTQKEIANMFGVGQDVISRIKNKKAWGHI